MLTFKRELNMEENEKETLIRNHTRLCSHECCPIIKNDKKELTTRMKAVKSN